MRKRLKVTVPAVWLPGSLCVCPYTAPASLRPEDTTLPQKLKDLDAYVQKVVKDWNVPGLGVGIVVKDKVVFAKGYGFRDYGKKLPFTAQTTVPIASNTKLFTAVGARPPAPGGKLSR